MSFKDQIVQDLDTVFLNLGEFAELHRVEGRQISIVVDNNRLQSLKQGQILGLVESDMLIMGRKVDFPADLSPGRLLNVDGREMIVADSGEDMGLVEVALNQNRTG